MTRSAAPAGLLFMLMPLTVLAQDPPAVEAVVTPVAGSVHLLVGQGGNLGVSAGSDGVFVIDDQYAPMTENILKALARLNPSPPKFVVNTHWHFDHTGGNENFGKAGAVIVAHDNVRMRMSTDQFIKAFGKAVPAAPSVARPVITFAESVTFHLNGDDIHVFHVPPAHTDGDSMVHFRKADVLHMGDVFFNGLYPFIDLGSGGSVDGVIAAVDQALALAGPKSRIIPGHGPIASTADLQAYRNMLAGARDKVAALKSAGKSLTEVQAARPTAAWDKKWGNGFLKPDNFVAIIYEGVQ